MIEYKNEIRSRDGHIYSLDMIRLNLEFMTEFQGFLDWLMKSNISEDNLDVKHWLSVKEFSFRNMFKVETDRYSFAMAIGFNGRSEDRNKGWIEFNPNKCCGDFFDRFMRELNCYVLTSKVVRYDLAIDIPIPRYLVKLKRDGRNYEYIKSQSSETEYLGRRNHVGRVKLYDKKAESNLDYELTRIEITADLETFNFPTVNIMPLQQNINLEEITASDSVLIELLRQVENPNMYLGKLHYRKRKKIEPYLWQDTVQLDGIAHNEILKQVIKYHRL